jgi:mono/diheme cytochrome c family protein
MVRGTAKRKVLGIALLFLLSVLISACSDSAEADALSEEEQLGQLVFSQTCAACHATSADLVIVGPSLAGIGQRAETRVANQDGRTYMENSIRDPAEYIAEGFTDLMPPVLAETLTSEEIDAVIAYLYTLE